MRRWPDVTLTFLLCLASACGKKETPPQPLIQSSVPTPDNSTHSPALTAKSVPPEPFEKLSPEAKAIWLKADIKPTIPKNLDKRPAAEQVQMLETIGKLEARQREADKDRPRRESYRAQREAEDRAELVHPAPPNFKTQAGRKVQLTLISRKAMMRKGETFWYRMEMRNVGQEPIALDDRPSFWKIGDAMLANRYRFFITPPEGREKEVYVFRYPQIHPSPIEMDYPASMTKAESDRAFERLLEEKENEVSRRVHLRVTLQPGETLVSRPWRFGTGIDRLNKMEKNENPDPPVSGAFRELAPAMSGKDEFKFDKPGTYRIKLVLNDTARRPTEEDIQRRIKIGLSREYTMKDYEEKVAIHLGRIESNVVTLEVMR